VIFWRKTAKLCANQRVRHFPMPAPETTSAEGLERYVGGKCLLSCRGKAWQEIKASIFALPSSMGTLNIPSVSEPVLVWITSGDVSGFTDVALNSLLEQLHAELKCRKASPLFVQGIAQAIAIHLARNYAVTVKKSHSGSPSLPGYKLRRTTDWMTEHVVEDFDLARLAAFVGLSKYHFHRLFKSAMRVSPSRYHTNLRMELARRLLRETKKSVVAVAFEVGYSNPSHFAQLFRRQTGLFPSDYRRQR
jgi:AraC-like DNA-binding protein